MQFKENMVICLLISAYKPITKFNNLLLMHLASGTEVPLSPAGKSGNRDRDTEIKFTKETCGKAGNLDSMSPDQDINHKINAGFFFTLISPFETRVKCSFK